MKILLFLIPVLYFEVIRFYACKPDGCGAGEHAFLAVPGVFFLILGISLQFGDPARVAPQRWLLYFLVSVPFLSFVAGMVATVLNMLY